MTQNLSAHLIAVPACVLHLISQATFSDLCLLLGMSCLAWSRYRKGWTRQGSPYWDGALEFRRWVLPRT